MPYSLKAQPAARRWLIAALGLLLAGIGMAGSPMLLVAPMAIFTYLNRNRLRRWVRRLPFGLTFIGGGMIFGLLTEGFAILQNKDLPPAQRILLSPAPALDLFYAFFYYLLLMLTWCALLRHAPYSQGEVFCLTGVYGILTEEVGQVFLRIFTVPGTGLLYALMVGSIYGVFPMLAYMISAEKLPVSLRPKTAGRFAVATVVLAAEWAGYGLFVLPLLKRLPL